MGGFGQIMKNILNWQPSGSPAWARQQQAKVEQAQEARAAQQYDVDMASHLINDLHALPVVNGMVKYQRPVAAIAPAMSAPDVAASMLQPDQSPGSSQSPTQQDPSSGGGSNGGSGQASSMFDSEGNPNPSWTAGPAPTSHALLQAMMPGSVSGDVGKTTIVRKADSSRLVGWKDHTGRQVQFELPTEDEQHARQVAELQARSQAEAQGQEQGRIAALNEQREKYGTPLNPDLAAQYGVDSDQKFLPAEKVQLATRYFPVVGAGVRGQAMVGAAQTRADASKYRTDLQEQTKQAIADQQSMDRQTLLDHRDKWNAAIVAAKNNAQTNLNARAFVNNAERNMTLHTKLLGDVSTETQRQMSAQTLLANGPDGTPVTPDGQEFTNPWDGKKYTMNAAQRLRLQSGLAQSQSTVAAYQQNAAALENQRDAILNRFGGGVPGTNSAPTQHVFPDGSTTSVPSGPRQRLNSDGSTTAMPATPPSAAGPGSVNWAPRGWGVQQSGKQQYDPGRATVTPSKKSTFNGATTTGPGTPTSRPANWADGGRRSSAAGDIQADATGNVTVAATPTRAAATPSKTATTAQVQAYATKKGIPLQQALKEFQSSGYTVQ